MRMSFIKPNNAWRNAFIAVALIAGGLSAMAAPQVGDPAPDFRLQASDGKEYTLSEFKGKRPVVIAFFPKAFTGG